MKLNLINFLSEFLSYAFLSRRMPALNKFKLSAWVDLDLSSPEGLEGVYLLRILAVRT